MNIKKQCKWIDQVILISIISCVFLLLTPCHASAAKQIDKERLSKWAGAVCRDLGCMSISTQYYGVNMTAIGMVQDPSILQSFGFSFGEGPYRISATRIDTGRYRVRIQAMSRRDDNEWKLILLETQADKIYPVSIPAAPAGKYTWNAAIQFDMEDQLGIMSHYEKKMEPVSFVDLRVTDPAKLAAAGFPGYKKNDTSPQIIYKGNDKWEFNPGGVRPGGGMLMYRNGQWSSSGAAISTASTASTASKPETAAAPVEEKSSALNESFPETGSFTVNSLVFAKVKADRMTFNNQPFEWSVYEGRINDQSYYLVTSPDMGQALIDVNQNAMFDAETARQLSGGYGMTLNMNDLPRIESSGAQLTALDSGKTINAWWENGTLSFTLGGAALPVNPEAQTAVASSETLEETPAEPAMDAKGLLFDNSDFETGDLTNWTADGDAFNFQPTKGDNPTARARRTQPSQHQGDFWIGTFEKYQGTAGERPGMRQGDRPTGTLTSIPFEIKAQKICFLIGGGRYKQTETVSLVVDGQTVMSATGKGNETLEPVVWDVAAYKGRTAQIVITDAYQGGWGHINADDFRYPE